MRYYDANIDDFLLSSIFNLGEGIHQVMETVESGLLESDNDDTVSGELNQASETGLVSDKLFTCDDCLAAFE